MIARSFFHLLFLLPFVLCSTLQAEEEQGNQDTTEHIPTFFQDGVRAQAFTDVALQQGIGKIISRVSFGWALWDWKYLHIAGGLDTALSLKGHDLTSFGPTLDMIYTVLPQFKVGLWGTQSNGYYPREAPTDEQNKYVDVSSRTVGFRLLYQPYRRSAAYLGFGQRTAIRMLAPTDADDELKSKIEASTSSVMLGFRFST